MLTPLLLPTLLPPPAPPQALEDLDLASRRRQDARLPSLYAKAATELDALAAYLA